MLQVKLGVAAKAAKVSDFSTLRFNANGYPYITFVTRDAKSNCVYFGKKSTDALEAEGLIAEDSVKHLMATASLIDTINEQGEQRFKISLQGISDYESAADVFGYELEEDGKFDFKRFIGEFTAKVLVPTNADDLSEN